MRTIDHGHDTKTDKKRLRRATTKDAQKVPKRAANSSSYCKDSSRAFFMSKVPTKPHSIALASRPGAWMISSMWDMNPPVASDKSHCSPRPTSRFSTFWRLCQEVTGDAAWMMICSIRWCFASVIVSKEMTSAFWATLLMERSSAPIAEVEPVGASTSAPAVRNTKRLTKRRPFNMSASMAV